MDIALSTRLFTVIIMFLVEKLFIASSHRVGYLSVIKVTVSDLHELGEPAIPSISMVGCTVACIGVEQCAVAVRNKKTRQCWFLTQDERNASLTESVGDNQGLTAVVVKDHICEVEAFPIAESCQAHHDLQHHADGLYATYDRNWDIRYQVCHMDYYGPNWVVIQRRVDDSVSFYRGWQDYKQQFGDLEGNFWLGLEDIHQLCMPNCELYAYLVAEFGKEQICSAVDSAYAHYTTFSIASESEGYMLTISGYSGTAGDGLGFGNGHKFTTFDQDNDVNDAGNCASSYKGGWWYTACHSANPNGLYLDGSHPEIYAQGIDWNPYKGYYYSLKYIEIKVKPF